MIYTKNNYYLLKKTEWIIIAKCHNIDKTNYMFSDYHIIWDIHNNEKLEEFWTLTKEEAPKYGEWKDLGTNLNNYPEYFL